MGQTNSSRAGQRDATRHLLTNGPTPLYHQLERDLSERIAIGEFKPGDSLPTEERICAQYSVSRITVRRALEAMIVNGLIMRRRGIGTFVAEPPETKRSVRFTASLDDFLSRAGALSQEVLSLGIVRAPKEVCESLKLAKGAEVVRLELVSSLSSGPVMYLEIYFPRVIGDHLDRADIVSGSPVVRVIERKLKIRVVRASQLIEPDTADRTVADHLEIALKTPVLRIRRIYYTAGDKPVEVAILRHHPQRYQYGIEFTTRPFPV